MKEKRTPFAVLKFRDFRLLWVGLAISRIGSEMQVVALSWHLYLLTGSAFSLGLIGLSRFLPLISFSLFGGMLADVFDRRKIVIVTQSVMTLCALLLAIMTFSGQTKPGLIYLLIAIDSLAVTFDIPARQALVPQIVPKEYFLNAVALLTTMWQTAVVLGPSIAGFILASSGVATVYTINAVSFLAVIIALFLMKPVKKFNNGASFNLKTLIDGFRFLEGRPVIYSTMILDFFATFFASATVLLPIFAKDILMVGPRGLGFLYAAPSVGGIIAGAITSSLGKVKNQGKIVLIAVFFYGLATILFGLSGSFYLSLLFLFASGLADIAATVLRHTIRQLLTPDYMRGRIASIHSIFSQGGPHLGELEAGLLAGTFGARTSVVIGGIGTIIVTLLVSLLLPKLRNYQGGD